MPATPWVGSRPACRTRVSAQPAALPLLTTARFSLIDLLQLERSPLLHVGFQALDAFQAAQVQWYSCNSTLRGSTVCGALACGVRPQLRCTMAVASRSLCHYPPPCMQHPASQHAHAAHCILCSPQGRLPEPGSQEDAASLLQHAKAVNDAASEKVGCVCEAGTLSFTSSLLVPPVQNALIRVVCTASSVFRLLHAHAHFPPPPFCFPPTTCSWSPFLLLSTGGARRGRAPQAGRHRQGQPQPDGGHVWRRGGAGGALASAAILCWLPVRHAGAAWAAGTAFLARPACISSTIHPTCRLSRFAPQLFLSLSPLSRRS